MNYTEITQAALDYRDRPNDQEVIGNLDTFLRIVESRLNKKLTVQEMSARTKLTTVEGQEYYGLPPDFKALRDIQYKADNAVGLVTLEYVNPKQANDANNRTNLTTCYYTIIADQLQLVPPPVAGLLEVVYMRKVSALVSSGDNSTNWVSEDYPEIYIFGLCAEISAFAKDADAFAIWDGRFQDSMDVLEEEDSSSRWSGTPLKMRIG